MLQYADLHIHSEFSDGSYSFPEIISNAAKNSIACISITDHENVEIYACPEFENYCGNIEIIKGVELSVSYQGKEVHLLGYFNNGLDKSVLSVWADMKKERFLRAMSILEKLKELGINLDTEEFKEFVKDSSVSRMHIAVFMQKKGFISSLSDAFNKYIGEGCPAYIPRKRFNFEQGVEFLKKQGALVFLAHPVISGLDPFLKELAVSGIDGIEAFYPSHSPEKTKYYLDFASRYNLLVSGGSDCHGEFKNNANIGTVKLPYEYVEQIKQAKR